MKKLIIVSLSVLTMASCTKDIESYNERTKSYSNVPAETLFSNGVRNLTDALASASVNVNVFRYTLQQWAATTYQDEPNYDFITRNIPQTWWRTLYRDVLTDLKESARLLQEDETVVEAEKKNKLAIIDMMQVYTFTVLVNTYGNIPYADALDYNVLFPKYDDAKTVYDDLITRLTADVAALDPAVTGISDDQDLLYGGDVAAWKTFGNSLLIRMAMTIADVDDAKAKSIVESVNASAFMSPDDNAEFEYLAATPNTNPIWVDLVQSLRQDVVAGKPFIDKIKEMGDPRLPLYFRPNSDGEYVGGVVGANNTFATVAKPSEAMVAPDFPALLLDYVEIEFFRAEAVERGYAIDGTAAEHYENAIRASILYWGGTETEADAYLAKPAVAYATATGTWKEKIGLQKWIGLYNRPFAEWTEIRRLDYPVLSEPAAAKSGFPVRLEYPQNEQQLNGPNYTSASSSIGGDDVETKLWWDKF